MPSLILRCELLLGSYQAADPLGPPDRAEWPPHPLRLHAALLGAACAAGGEDPSPEAIDALRWLERQGAPTISACVAEWSRDAAEAFVPRNPVRAEFKGNRLPKVRAHGPSHHAWARNPRSFPTAIPTTEPGEGERPATIHYAWELAEAPPPVLEALADGVGWLGSSRSPVSCARVANGPEPSLRSHPDGPRALRVASPGTTDALLASRHTWPPPQTGTVARYGSPSQSKSEPKIEGGPYELLLTRRIVRATHAIRYASVLTTALRSAVLSQAGDGAPDVLHGHGAHPHAAYLALPDAGHPHATGVVRGIGIAVPSRTTTDERAIVSAALARIDRVSLGAGRPALALASGPAEEILATRPERWMAPSRSFVTVTPVVLDRFPRRERSVSDEIIASIRNAGIPEPDDVEFARVPLCPGAASAHEMRGPVPPGLRIHLRLQFGRPVRGPLMIGRGRYRGIGLLMPERRRT